MGPLHGRTETTVALGLAHVGGPASLALMVARAMPTPGPLQVVMSKHMRVDTHTTATQGVLLRMGDAQKGHPRTTTACGLGELVVAELTTGTTRTRAQPVTPQEDATLPRGPCTSPAALLELDPKASPAQPQEDTCVVARPATLVTTPTRPLGPGVAGLIARTKVTLARPLHEDTAPACRLATSATAHT